MRATKQITVEEGQTIYDIAGMYYGSVKAVALLLADNNLGFDVVLARGQKLTIQNNIIPNPDEYTSGGTYQETAVKTDYEKNFRRINTGDYWQEASSFDFSFDFSFDA